MWEFLSIAITFSAPHYLYLSLCVCTCITYNALYKVRFNTLYTLLALVRIINDKK